MAAGGGRSRGVKGSVGEDVVVVGVPVSKKEKIVVTLTYVRNSWTSGPAGAY